MTALVSQLRADAVELPLPVPPGAAIYNPWVLSVYDLAVLHLSNRLAWRCPVSNFVDLYNRHVGDRHLDAGVGTGYFLDKCVFPTEKPHITLLDVNTHALQVAGRRIARYRPRTVVANLLHPLPLQRSAACQFDSIGLCYVLHCLPGTLRRKGAVIASLAQHLAPSGVLFGTTLLGKESRQTGLGKVLHAIYNASLIMQNRDDTLADLELVLRQTFNRYEVRVCGSAALFAGWKE